MRIEIEQPVNIINSIGFQQIYSRKKKKNNNTLIDDKNMFALDANQLRLDYSTTTMDTPINTTSLLYRTISSNFFRSLFPKLSLTVHLESPADIDQHNPDLVTSSSPLHH